MTKVTVTRISSKVDAQLATTVEFLREAREKGFEQNVGLRTYLKSKHGLTSQQIDRAFSIVNENSFGSEEVKKSKPSDEDGKHEQKDVSTIFEEHQKDNQPKLKSANNVDREFSSSDNYQARGLLFLMAGKRALGEKKLRVFMKSEASYCSILNCLHGEYYGALVNMANKNKFKMSRLEVEEIFEYIPDMLKFHRDTLPMQLGQGEENIGKTFLRYIKAFVFYIDYMKECSSTVNKMGKYTDDKKLHKCLKSIKKKSAYRNTDMVDLLIIPLQRISEYKLFLDTLLNWADKSRQSDYVLISKAARRLGRVVEYIMKYKDGIINKNEINKVQEFLRGNYRIATPKRQIIRRGLMIRHFPGWSTRNKTFIFFLFNDVMFWTSRKGDMQTVLLLRYCWVLDADSKHNPGKKLKIVYQGGKKKKIFDLECSSEQQRKQWFNAISKAISNAKVTHKESDTSKPGHSKSNESFSCEPIAPILISQRSLSGSRSNTTRNQSCDFDETEENTGYGQYEYSQNFEECDFKEFEPREDTISVKDFEYREDTISISELDYIYGERKKGDGLLDFLCKSESSGKLKIQIGEMSTEKLKKITEECDLEGDHEDDSNDEVSAPFEPLAQDFKSSSIIRRVHSNASLDAVPLETRSNITIRLNDFVQEVNM